MFSKTRPRQRDNRTNASTMFENKGTRPYLVYMSRPHIQAIIYRASVAIMVGGAVGIVLAVLKTASGLCVILVALGAGGVGVSQVLVMRQRGGLVLLPEQIRYFFESSPLQLALGAPNARAAADRLSTLATRSNGSNYGGRNSLGDVVTVTEAAVLLRSLPRPLRRVLELPLLESPLLPAPIRRLLLPPDPATSGPENTLRNGESAGGDRREDRQSAHLTARARRVDTVAEAGVTNTAAATEAEAEMVVTPLTATELRLLHNTDTGAGAEGGAHDSEHTGRSEGPPPTGAPNMPEARLLAPQPVPAHGRSSLGRSSEQSSTPPETTSSEASSDDNSATPNMTTAAATNGADWTSAIEADADYDDEWPVELQIVYTAIRFAARRARLSARHLASPALAQLASSAVSVAEAVGAGRGGVALGASAATSAVALALQLRWDPRSRRLAADASRALNLLVSGSAAAACSVLALRALAMHCASTGPAVLDDDATSPNPERPQRRRSNHRARPHDSTAPRSAAQVAHVHEESTNSSRSSSSTSSSASAASTSSGSTRSNGSGGYSFIRSFFNFSVLSAGSQAGSAAWRAQCRSMLLRVARIVRLVLVFVALGRAARAASTALARAALAMQLRGAHPQRNGIGTLRNGGSSSNLGLALAAGATAAAAGMVGKPPGSNPSAPRIPTPPAWGFGNLPAMQPPTSRL